MALLGHPFNSACPRIRCHRESAGGRAGEGVAACHHPLAHSPAHPLVKTKSTRFYVCVGILCALALSFSLFAQVFREPDLKALFLYNFPQFVDWPPETFRNAASPLLVGIIGKDRLVARALDDLTRTESSTRRKMTALRIRDVAEASNCHIVFIDKSEAGNLKQILAKFQGKPILTVSDSDAFTSQGGMIQFITDLKEKRIRLRINVAAAKAANLSISSKLLKLADIE